MENRLEELKQVIANSRRAIEDEFLGTTNSWLACFHNSVSVVETLLNNPEIKPLFSLEKYALAMERMEELKRWVAELKEQYPDRNTIPPKDIKIGLFTDLLSILLGEDEYVALSEDYEIMGRAHSIWHKRLEGYKQNQKNFLAWVKDNYSLRKVYYAGSGSDKIPKKILGEEVVVHLSLGPDNRGAKGYFTRLGSGIKIDGDFLKSPFKDKSFDAVFIHNTPHQVTIEGLNEFARVLKDDGILILDNGDWYQEEVGKFFLATHQLFEELPFSSQFHAPRLVKAFEQSVIEQLFVIFKKQTKSED